MKWKTIAWNNVAIIDFLDYIGQPYSCTQWGIVGSENLPIDFRTSHPIIIDDEDYPDEFLDPIESTLIVNPIVLPVSNIIIDKKSILRWLLTKKEDPFSRNELTEDILNKYNESKEAKILINKFKENFIKFKNK